MSWLMVPSSVVIDPDPHMMQLREAAPSQFVLQSPHYDPL